MLNKSTVTLSLLALLATIAPAAAAVGLVGQAPVPVIGFGIGAAAVAGAFFAARSFLKR